MLRKIRNVIAYYRVRYSIVQYGEMNEFNIRNNMVIHSF